MNVLIAGSRGITNREAVEAAIADSGFKITRVLSGGAAGVDTLGEEWAFRLGIPVLQYKPDWKRYGRAAGMCRNIDMIDSADAAIFIWDGESPGTAQAISYAKATETPSHITLHRCAP